MENKGANYGRFEIGCTMSTLRHLTRIHERDFFFQFYHLKMKKRRDFVVRSGIVHDILAHPLYYTIAPVCPTERHGSGLCATCTNICMAWKKKNFHTTYTSILLSSRGEDAVGCLRHNWMQGRRMYHPRHDRVSQRGYACALHAGKTGGCGGGEKC